jgi:hypothetical protein
VKGKCLETYAYMVLKKQGVEMWTGFFWLRIGTTGGFL